MSGRRDLHAVCAVFLAVGLLAGCSGESGPDQPDDEAAPSASPRQAFDPPANFGPPAATMSLDGTVPKVKTLDGLSGWALGSSGLTRVDLATQTVQPAVFPDRPLIADLDVDDRSSGGGTPKNPLGAPVVADTPAGRLALAAFPVETPGQGTTPTERFVELVAAESGTARKAFSVAVPLESLRGRQRTGLSSFKAAVVGVVGSTAVVSAGTINGAVTAGIDVSTRQVLWTVSDVAGKVIAGDTVVATNQSLQPELRGLSVRNGARLWSLSEGGTISPMGPKNVLVSHEETFRRSRGATEVLDAATGRPVKLPIGQDQTGWSCKYDSTSTTVCQLEGYSGDVSALIGFDDAGTELWRIEAKPGGRVAPAVTAAWHGAIYGYTESGAVVLDARTGADRTATAGLVAPLVVNEYWGIAPGLPGSPGRTPDYTSPRELVAMPATA